jgi:hypothetical protein
LKEKSQVKKVFQKMAAVAEFGKSFKLAKVVHSYRLNDGESLEECNLFRVAKNFVGTKTSAVFRQDIGHNTILETVFLFGRSDIIRNLKKDGYHVQFAVEQGCPQNLQQNVFFLPLNMFLWNNNNYDEGLEIEDADEEISGEEDEKITEEKISSRLSELLQQLVLWGFIGKNDFNIKIFLREDTCFGFINMSHTLDKNVCMLAHGWIGLNEWNLPGFENMKIKLRYADYPKKHQQRKGKY